MSDVLLSQTPDGADITVEGGTVELSAGLRTSAFLCLFGGNENDVVSDSESRAQWWGNFDEPADRVYRSEFQTALQNLPSIPLNLRKLEQATLRDLQHFLDIGAATEVSASAFLVSPKKVQLNVSINANGAPETISFYTNWEAAINGA